MQGTNACVTAHFLLRQTLDSVATTMRTLSRREPRLFTFTFPAPETMGRRSALLSYRGFARDSAIVDDLLPIKGRILCRLPYHFPPLSTSSSPCQITSVCITLEKNTLPIFAILPLLCPIPLQYHPAKHF